MVIDYLVSWSTITIYFTQLCGFVLLSIYKISWPTFGFLGHFYSVVCSTTKLAFCSPSFVNGICEPLIWQFHKEEQGSLIPYLTTYSASSLWRFFSYYAFYSLSFYLTFCFCRLYPHSSGNWFFLLWWEALVISLFNRKYGIHSAQLMVRLSFVHVFAWSFVTILCLQRHMSRFSTSIVCLCM